MTVLSSLQTAVEKVYLARVLDEKMFKLVRQSKGGTFHLFTAGHELIGAIAGLTLRPGSDWALPYYRDRAFALGLGCTPEELLTTFLAREHPHHSGGRMMPDHFSHRQLRIPCQSSCVGSQFLQAVGVALGCKLRGTDEIVYVSAGDGATSQGDFHEALNFATLHCLPLLFVIQNNGWAISVPAHEQTSGGSIAQMTSGYSGLSVVEVDGTDYPATVSALELSALRARRGEGPTLLVANVPRLGPHSSSDDPKKYKDAHTIAAEALRDPIPRFEQWLISEGHFTLEELTAIRRTQFDLVEAAAQEAEKAPFPSRASAATKLYAPYEPKGQGAEPGEAIVLMDALNHALVEEMTRDAGVLVFGQDVAHGKGGVFGITRTLTERFGATRCFNTPLAESTIIGVALGLSLDGHHKPVVEIQFSDYSWTGINQLFNELASYHYRSNGEWHCPVVIRMPSGGYIQGGPYHSQSIEAYLAHTPGLKIAYPSNAADAKRLLKAAIRDPNPVVFLEHKALYRQRLFAARPETGSEDLLPFGQAQITRPGKDLTVVSYGLTLLMAHEVAEALASENISAEVIDLRTLNPLDLPTVLASVQKTGKLLVAHEAPLTCGFGAELLARIAEQAFSSLDAPPVRVCGKDTPVPYCKDLEESVLPQKRDIEQAIRKLFAY